MKLDAQTRQVLRQDVLRETRLFLVQIDRDQFKVDGRARLQLEQDIQQAMAVLAAAVGWSFAQLWPTSFGQGMPVATGSAIAMILVFITLLIWTLMTRARLKPGATLNRLHPLVAARTAALAMSASRWIR